MSEEQQQALLAELGMDVAPSTLVSELNSLGIYRGPYRKSLIHTRGGRVSPAAVFILHLKMPETVV